MRMPLPTRVAAALGTSLVLVLAACTSSSDDGSTSSPSAGGSTAAGSTAPTGSSSAPSSSAPGLSSAKQLYVSVGDSYAAGYQATGRQQGGTTRNGYAYQVVDDAKSKGYRFTLANFGCSGATTDSALNRPGCRGSFLGPGAKSYGSKTQAEAAVDYLKAHKGKVGLITVSLGGNDIYACSDDADPTSCVSRVLDTAKKNLTTLLGRLRSAAGPSARIVGITYPDVFLGGLIKGDAKTKQLANLSVLAFQGLINPALQSTYESVGGSFVDVTKATGAYGSLTETTTLAPYGTIPVPVAKVCRYTYFCEYGDIHPRTTGYALISKLIVGTLPAR